MEKPVEMDDSGYPHDLGNLVLLIICKALAIAVILEDSPKWSNRDNHEFRFYIRIILIKPTRFFWGTHSTHMVPLFSLTQLVDSPLPWPAATIQNHLFGTTRCSWISHLLLHAGVPPWLFTRPSANSEPGQLGAKRRNNLSPKKTIGFDTKP